MAETEQLPGRQRKSAALQYAWSLAASLALAGLVGGLVMAASGVSPWRGYGILLRGTFGDTYGLATVLDKTAVLSFTGLAVALPFLAGLFNIGAEGQLYAGALGSAAVGIYLAGLPPVILLPATLLAGFLAGALWGAIPGWLKARFGANEVITSLMLSYVAIQVASYMVTGPMKEPPGYLPQTPLVAAGARLAPLSRLVPVHGGILLAVAALLCSAWLLWRTPFGYEIRFVGDNRRAAEMLGIAVNRTTVLVFALGGGLAGLAGSVELLGVQGRLLEGFSPGYGFDGIAVALMGVNHPAGVGLAALVFGALRAGGGDLQRLTGTPVALVFVVQGLLVIALAARTVFQGRSWQIFPRRPARAEAQTPVGQPIEEVESP